VTLSPVMLERIRQGWGDVPEIRLLIEEVGRLRDVLGAISRADLPIQIGGSISDPGASLRWCARQARNTLGEREP